MRSPPVDPHAALRRSHLRFAVLLALDRKSESYLAALEREVESHRVRDALEGGHGFRCESSLVALGLAEEVRSRIRGMRAFRITPKGRKVAREARERSATLAGPRDWPGLRYGLLPNVP